MTEKYIPKLYIEIVCTALLFAMAIICAYPSHGVSNFLVPESLSSNTYSMVIGYFMIFFCVYHLSNLILNYVRKQYQQTQVKLTFAWIAMLMFLVYGLGFTYIGFYISTFLFLCILSYYLTYPDDRNIKSTLMFAVCATISIYIVFRLFKIYIPPALFV